MAITTKNKLSSVILDSKDCCTLLFMDNSQYLSGAKNPILRITPPNFSSYIDVEYFMNGLTILRADDIKHDTFPSGVYHFVQSVCPNDKVQYSFCYLNVCKELDLIAQLFCDESEEVQEEALNLMYEFDIAQRMVTTCGIEKAVELYNIASKKLNLLRGKSTCQIY